MKIELKYQRNSLEEQRTEIIFVDTEEEIYQYVRDKGYYSFEYCILNEEKCVMCNKYFNLNNLHTGLNKDECIYVCNECYKEIEKPIENLNTETYLEYKKVKIIYQDLEGEIKEIDIECLGWKGFENKLIKYV